MTQSKYDIKAAEYRALAAGSTAAAEACVLDHAREQHQASADRWTALAEAEESRAERQRQIAGV
ncbi:MAG: hypothetical protein JSR98_05020 [Proteobacteria bacterium]|nr:hypothetical protein [Pseudomonadota bacterium]